MMVERPSATYFYANSIFQDNSDEGLIVGSEEGNDWLVLHGTAIDVWRALDEHHTIDSVTDGLLEHFEGDRQQIRKDVETLVESFVRAGIIVARS